MFKSGIAVIISGVYILLLVIFTAYHANHFDEYTDKKGDESFIYVVVISSISYLYYFAIFVVKKMNVIVIIFVPFVYVLASVGLSIFIGLLAGRNTAWNFYVCTLANIGISVFLVQAMMRKRLYNNIRSRFDR